MKTLVSIILSILQIILSLASVVILVSAVIYFLNKEYMKTICCLLFCITISLDSINVKLRNIIEE